MVGFFSSMVSIFVRAISCLSCSESQVCENRKQLLKWFTSGFICVPFQRQISTVAWDAFCLSWSSGLPQITFPVTVNLLGLWQPCWGRSVSGAVPLKPMPILLEVTLAPRVQASFVLQRAFLFNTHMIPWTGWVFLHIMVQIKYLWPSVKLGYVWLPLKLARSTAVERASWWMESLDVFHHPAVSACRSSSLPTPAAKRAQSAPDTGEGQGWAAEGWDAAQCF